MVAETRPKLINALEVSLGKDRQARTYTSSNER
jgi:hypothetical protein